MCALHDLEVEQYAAAFVGTGATRQRLMHQDVDVIVVSVRITTARVTTQFRCQALQGRLRLWCANKLWSFRDFANQCDAQIQRPALDRHEFHMSSQIFSLCSGFRCSTSVNCAEIPADKLKNNHLIICDKLQLSAECKGVGTFWGDS